MHAGQNANFASDLANLVERAGIRTAPASQHVVAENVFAQPLEGAGGELALVVVFFGNGRDDFGLDGVERP